MTHRFHPYCGREFALVTYRQNWGADRVYFHDERGQLRSLSARWTSIGPADPFVVISAGRAAFRTSDLLKLVDLLDQVQEANRDA